MHHRYFNFDGINHVSHLMTKYRNYYLFIVYLFQAALEGQGMWLYDDKKVNDEKIKRQPGGELIMMCMHWYYHQVINNRL